MAPVTAIPQSSSSFGFDYHQVTVVLPWESLARPHIAVSEHEQVPTPGEPPLYWLRSDGPGWTIDGRTWRAGRNMDGRAFDREIAAAAFVEDGTELLRAPLGRGHVTAGLFAHGRLWFVLGRRARGADEVVTVDPDTGAVTTVLRGDAVDITDRCWPLPDAPPSDASAHARRWLDRLSDLDHYWQPENGPRTPLANGMSDSTAELDGQWPDLAVSVTFRHPWLPGGLLRRRIPLFDELGRAVDPEYCDIGLMEDLDTRDLPPVTEAVDGALEI